MIYLSCVQTQKGQVRFSQILDTLLLFCNGGFNVHRLFSLGATPVWPTCHVSTEHPKSFSVVWLCLLLGLKTSSLSPSELKFCISPFCSFITVKFVLKVSAAVIAFLKKHLNARWENKQTRQVSDISLSVTGTLHLDWLLRCIAKLITKIQMQSLNEEKC